MCFLPVGFQTIDNRSEEIGDPANKEVVRVEREVLISALEERGLTVTVKANGGMRVFKPGLALMAEEISFSEGQPCWSWNGRVTAGDSVSEAAERISAVVSVPPGVVRNSS